MKALFCLCVTLICLPALAAGQWWQDEDSWKKPLTEKARIFEDNVLRNHWIQGLYPSMVNLPWDGGPPDQTTAGNSNIAHSCCWTANYLAGQAYRYRFTKDPAVRRHCGEMLQALTRIQQMTGKTGLQARGYVLGHGPSYEERGSFMAEHWHQGAGEFANYRWRGDPSHHNYDAVIHGLGAYYDLAADDEQKKLIRQDIYNLMSYIVDNDMRIADEYGRSFTFLGYTDGHTPNLRTLMVTSCLKTAYHVTGDEKFNRAYQKLVDQYGYRTAKSFKAPPKYTDFDDAEHVFGGLDNMFRQEKDPQLLAFYRMVLEALWQVHKDDGQAFYSYLYHGLSGKDGNDAAALDMLRHYPTVKVVRPRMNSIRDDIAKATDPETGEVIARDPVPMNIRPVDNEYEWKGSPYRLDGWLSPPIAQVTAAPEDPNVMLLIQEGGQLFRSLDGGGRWTSSGATLGDTAVRQVAFYGPRMRFVIAATSSGICRSTDAGLSWHRVAAGNGQGARQVMPAATAADSFWVVMDDGAIMRSLPLNPESPGEAWETVTQLPAPLRSAAVAIAPGAEPTVYAGADAKCYTWRAGEGWRAAGEIGRFAGTLSWLRLTGGTLYAGGAFGSEENRYPAVWSSDDGGRTWKGILGGRIRALAAAYTGQRIGGAGLEGTINDLVADPRRASRLLCATSSGVFVSDDGGQNWEKRNSGLRIERAYRVFAPAETAAFYASTPGGLFESRDDGKTWQEGNLPLTGTLVETGSGDFLTAYWIGRYYGFITEEQASALPQ